MKQNPVKIVGTLYSLSGTTFSGTIALNLIKYFLQE